VTPQKSVKKAAKGPAKPVQAPAPIPPTVIVYAGASAEVDALAARAGLDLKNTRLIPDADLAVSYDVYHSDPCPRVFVLAGDGRIRYVNEGTEDHPRTAPALLIASRALDALRGGNSGGGKRP
jgi:hypothetical protein